MNLKKGNIIYSYDLNQKIAASGIYSGNKNYSTWIEPNKLISIYDIKEDLLYILSDVGIDIDNLFIKRSQNLCLKMNGKFMLH